MAELEKPVKRLVDDLMSVQIPEPTASRPGPQEWVKRLCKHRDLFAQKVLCVCGDSLKHYYYFLYATQSPQDVILAPLELERTLAADQVGPCSPAGAKRLGRTSTGDAIDLSGTTLDYRGRLSQCRRGGAC